MSGQHETVFVFFVFVGGKCEFIIITKLNDK